MMVDVNGNYTVDICLQSLKLIEPYNVQWVEEPLPFEAMLTLPGLALV